MVGVVLFTKSAFGSLDFACEKLISSVGLRAFFGEPHIAPNKSRIAVDTLKIVFMIKLHSEFCLSFV